MAPGSLAEWFASSTADGARAPVGEVLVSNTSGVFGGAVLSDQVFDELELRFADLPVDVGSWKQELLTEAEDAELTTVFSSIGAFAVIAVIAVILPVVNIIVMLAEERRVQLGVLRSLGLKRNQVVRVFGLEGTGYTLAASALVVLVGMGVGWVVSVFARSLLASDEFSLQFAMDTSSLVTGGLIVTLLTVWGASHRLA
ncbi:MAG: putative ABC transport system permease protein [Candidatus Poriferisodalaceae bacterium]